MLLTAGAEEVILLSVFPPFLIFDFLYTKIDKLWPIKKKFYEFSFKFTG